MHSTYHPKNKLPAIKNLIAPHEHLGKPQRLTNRPIAPPKTRLKYSISQICIQFMMETTYILWMRAILYEMCVAVRHQHQCWVCLIYMKLLRVNTTVVAFFWADFMCFLYVFNALSRFMFKPFEVVSSVILTTVVDINRSHHKTQITNTHTHKHQSIRLSRNYIFRHLLSGWVNDFMFVPTFLFLPKCLSELTVQTN